MADMVQRAALGLQSELIATRTACLLLLIKHMQIIVVVGGCGGQARIEDHHGLGGHCIAANSGFCIVAINTVLVQLEEGVPVELEEAVARVAQVSLTARITVNRQLAHRIVPISR